MKRLGYVSLGVLFLLGSCSSDAKKSATTTSPDKSASVTTADGSADSPTDDTASGGADTTAGATDTEAAATDGGDGGPTASGISCATVTPEDVAAAFGGISTAGVLNEGGDGCDFSISGTTKTGDAGFATFLSITLGGEYISYDEELKVFPDVVKVDGLGDGAWFYSAASQLHIDLGGGKEVVISGNFPGDEAAIQAEVIEFGKTVVSKLS
jgi:hypothetical protein